MADLYMRIIISAQNSASGVIRGIAADAAAAKASLALMAGVGVLAVGAALAYSVVQAANFQQGLQRLVTGAGDTTDNMQKMGQAILGISVDTGVATTDLLASMYQILSAGQRGAQAENTLAVAARGAVVEQANVVDVTKALTTAMTDYGTKTYNATQFMNGYMKAVANGRISLEELSSTMGPILPLAQNLGIHFADVAAAMSTMTNAGIPAARAATSLRFLFQSLENPTKKASDAMTHWGLDSIKLANELKVSLPGALQMVYDAAKKAGPEGSVPFNRAVSDMIGGQRSLQAYLALTGGHMAAFASNTQQITAAMNGSKTAVAGWAAAQGNFNVQMDRAKAALAAAAINIGTLLLPVLTRLLAAIAPMIVAFSHWLVGIMQNKTALAIFAGIVAGLAAIILAVVVPAFIAWAAATIAATWPILLIGAIVAVVVAGVILAIQHWGQITTWLGNLWKTVSQWIGDRFSWLGGVAHTVITAIGGFFDWLGSKVHIFIVAWQFEFTFIGAQFSAFGTAIHNVITGIGNAFSALGGLVRGVWNGIVGAVKGAINFIIGLINGFIQGIDAISVHVGPINIGFSIPTIPYLASGGYITAPGLAYLHAGETVVPKGAGVKPGGGHTFNNTFNINVQQLDPREADRVTVLMADKLRAQFGNI